MPVITGEKPECERFPGAVTSLSDRGDDAGRQGAAGRHLALPGHELLRGDGHRLHRRGAAQSQFAHTTSWGTSTRLMGALVMTHGDDNGLRVPPRVAPEQVVIVPITRDDPEQVLEAARRARGRARRGCRPSEAPVRVSVDDRDRKPAEKRWEWIRKGAPVVVELGERDIERGVVTVTRRNDPELGREQMPAGRVAERGRPRRSRQMQGELLRGGHASAWRPAPPPTSRTSTRSASSSPATTPTRAASSARPGARTPRPRR